MNARLCREFGWTEQEIKSMSWSFVSACIAVLEEERRQTEKAQRKTQASKSGQGTTVHTYSYGR